MVDVLKAFYSVHYNFGILSILLVLLLIFFLTKKNFKFAIVTLAVVLVLNVGLYKRTDGKTWTITEEPEKLEDGSYSSFVKSTTFSARGTWVIKDDKGGIKHWCWLDQMWENFSQTDVIGMLWGENKSKKMIKASEGHANGPME